MHKGRLRAITRNLSGRYAPRLTTRRGTNRATKSTHARLIAFTLITQPMLLLILSRRFYYILRFSFFLQVDRGFQSEVIEKEKNWEKSLA